MIEIPITEAFDSAHGEFNNYTAYDVAQNEAVGNQKHIDIRCGLDRIGAYRRFDGTDDNIRTSLGNSNLTGALSLGALVRRRADGARHALVSNFNSGGTAQITLAVSVANNVVLNIGGTDSVGPSFTMADGWCMIAVSKAAGSTTPRFHKFSFNTGVWTHVDGSVPLGNPATQSGGSIRFGQQTADFFNGDYAAAAEWNRVFNDAETEYIAVAPRGYNGFLDSSPVGLWTLNQRSQLNPVRDWTAGKANQIAITGTQSIAERMPLPVAHPEPPIEEWTGARIDLLTTHGNMPVIVLPLVAGTNTFVSTIKDRLERLTRVDMSTGFDDNDMISLSFPTWPNSSVQRINSYIDFTSHPTGDFTAGPTASLNWGSSPADPSTFVAGNSELRFPRSALNGSGVDLSRVTAVRLRIQATGTATAYLAAMRLFSTDWQMTSIDMNTRSGKLVKTIAPTATTTPAYGFEFPRVFRSAATSNEDDPKPIDASIGVVFNTGQATGQNRFVIYFRELVEDYLTQLDIDGMTMEELNGHPQPDTGDGKWDVRELSTFEGLDMDELEGDLLRDLERAPDFDLSSWLGVSFQWGIDRSIVSGDSENNGISFGDVPLLDINRRYLAMMEIIENSFRFRIWPVTDENYVIYTDKVYDTSYVIDDFLIKRRKGRLGWDAKLEDGAAYIEEIRTRDLSFAEYRSFPLESHTPVEGAQIFAEFPPAEELFTTLADGPNGGTVTEDTGKSNSASSYKVVNPGTYPGAGARTNIIVFENFNDYEVEFDVWYPGAALADANYLRLFLVDDQGNKTEINFGNLVPDVWQSIQITPVEGNKVLTGRYYLSFEQGFSGESSTYWLDNLHVYRRSMRWEGRSQYADPWDDTPSTWVNFRDKVNDNHHGALFVEKGSHMQVRGKALRQNVTLGQVQVVPKYAELGRIEFGTQISDDDWAEDATRVLPSQNYMARASVYSPSADVGNAYVGIDFKAQDGTVIGSHYSDTVSTIQGQWITIACATEAPAGTVSATVWIWITDVLAGNIHYVDKVAFQKTKGFSPGSVGDPNNLLTYTQSTFGGATTGWTATNGTLTSTTEEAIHGAQSMKVACSGTSPTTVTTPTGTNGIPVVPGRVYEFSHAVKTAVTARGVASFVNFYNSGGTLISGGGPSSNDSTSWALRRNTSPAPAGAAFAAVQVIITSGAAAEAHYIDRCQFREIGTSWVAGGVSKDNLLSANQASFETDVSDWEKDEVPGNACNLSRTTLASLDERASMAMQCVGTQMIAQTHVEGDFFDLFDNEPTIEQQIKPPSTEPIDRIEIDWDEPPGQVIFEGSIAQKNWVSIKVDDITEAGWQTTVFDNPPSYDWYRFRRVDNVDMKFYDVVIRPKLKAPTAAYSTMATGFSVVFNGATSDDDDGRLIAYIWSFGDGTTGYGRNITHVYDESGTYETTLTVIDDTGLVDSQNASVTV